MCYHSQGGIWVIFARQYQRITDIEIDGSGPIVGRGCIRDVLEKYLMTGSRRKAVPTMEDFLGAISTKSQKLQVGHMFPILHGGVDLGILTMMEMAREAHLSCFKCKCKIAYFKITVLPVQMVWGYFE